MQGFAYKRDVKGCFVFCRAKKARAKSGIRLCAKRLTERTPSTPKVAMVSFQSKCPLPRITRTICARKTSIKTLTGKTKNKIRRKVILKSWKNSASDRFAAKALNEGKPPKKMRHQKVREVRSGYCWPA